MSKLPAPSLYANTSDDNASQNGLALLLGPRQADVMHLFWTYGSATVREIHARLVKEDLLENSGSVLLVVFCAQCVSRNNLSYYTSFYPTLSMDLEELSSYMPVWYTLYVFLVRVEQILKSNIPV